MSDLKDIIKSPQPYYIIIFQDASKLFGVSYILLEYNHKDKDIIPPGGVRPKHMVRGGTMSNKPHWKGYSPLEPEGLYIHWAIITLDFYLRRAQDSSPHWLQWLNWTEFKWPIIGKFQYYCPKSFAIHIKARKSMYGGYAKISPSILLFISCHGLDSKISNLTVYS